MNLKQVAECLAISTKLASRLIHEGKLFSVKVGREYRIPKTSVMHFWRGEQRNVKRKNCVVNVTSNPQDWIITEKCGIVSVATKRKEVG